jgi:hypothetical protein
MRAILVALSLTACAQTTLEPAANHPANPDAAPARAERATAVLEPGFEPFESYAEPTDEHSDHHVHPGTASP